MGKLAYILIIAGVPFLIRVIPLLLIRKPFRNRFIRSFLHYVPYVTLAVMTFPTILYAVPNPLVGAAALVIGIVLAWFNAGLFPVALSCCAAVLILEYLI